MHLKRAFVYLSSFVCVASFCTAQTAVLAPLPRQCFVDSLSAGKPLAGGLIYSCAAGTSCPGTPQATFTDSTGTRQNFNPVTLDGAGCTSMWLSTGLAYKFVAQNSSGVQEWSADNVTGLASTLTNSIASTTALAFSSTPTFTSLAQNQLFTMTLTGNVSSSNLVMSGITPPGLVSFEITQDGTGGRTFAWPVTTFGAASIATCANCTTTENFMWDGSTALLVSATYNVGGQNYPPDRADTLTGQYETINGGAGGAIVGYSFWGRHDSPSSTSSEVLITHKIGGTMPAQGTQASLTVENDIVGAVTPSTVTVISQEAYTAIRSTGGTFPDVRGMTSSVNFDLASSTSNVTTASDYFATQMANISSTATIANAYGFNGQAQIKGTARNYAGYFTQGASGTNNGAVLLGYNSGAAIDAEDSGGTPHRLLYEDVSANTILQALGTNGLLLKDSAGGTQQKILSTGTTFSTGIGADGSGFKHKRFGATCSTAATAGSFCTTTFSWTTAFADTSYTPVCTPVGPSNTGVFSLASFNAAGVTVEVVAGTAAAASYSSVDCVAIHD